jgi:glycopeptide antibiotics resistance protein
MILLAVIIYLPIFIKLQKNKTCVEKHIIILFFYLYLVKVVDVAFFPIFLHGGFQSTISFNLLPLKTIIADLNKFFYNPTWFILRPLVFNILMFVPMGYLLPLVSQKISKFFTVIIFSFGISLFIEILQLVLSLSYGFTFRFANVDDIIINVIGSALGFLLLKLTIPLLKKYIEIDLTYLACRH